MRIAVISDIHANREAFTAVLADAARRGVGQIICLGDVIGYGPDPEWCVERLRALCAAGTARCVLGNHDSALFRRETLNPVARAALDWTRPRLDAAQTGFLAGLPLTLREGELLFTHASAQAPADWGYVTSAATALPSFRVSDARVILCGHVHRPALYSYDLRGHEAAHTPPLGVSVPLIASRRWLAVLGSVGQPRDGVAQAGYAILDLPGPDLAAPGEQATNEMNSLDPALGRGGAGITFHRVPYDAVTTAQKIRAAGLPEVLAVRILEGR